MGIQSGNLLDRHRTSHEFAIFITEPLVVYINLKSTRLDQSSPKALCPQKNPKPDDSEVKVIFAPLSK